jgi:dimethylargininase
LTAGWSPSRAGSTGDRTGNEYCRNHKDFEPESERVVRNTPVIKTAMVRGVPATYDHCVRYDPSESIDVVLARQQHEGYCDALRGLGVDVVEVPPDDRYPDCCFVEDPVLVVDEYAVVASMGIASRRGEGKALREALSRCGKQVVEIKGPGTLEGGDVIRLGDRILVGLTGRTNRQGVEELEGILGGTRYEIVPLEVRDALHLKSVCAYLGDRHVVVVPGYFDESALADYDRIEVAARDTYAANCIALNGAVVVAEGFPEVRKRIVEAGFETIEVPMSEFRKCDGGLSCLSVRF